MGLLDLRGADPVGRRHVGPHVIAVANGRAEGKTAPAHALCNRRRGRGGRKQHAHYRDLVARDNAHADLALGFVAEARRDVADAETRLQATRDALDSIPSEVPRDRLLDFALDLREAIAGKAAKAHGVEEVNRVLAEHFTSFAISRGDWLPDDEGLHAHDGSHICIEPDLRPEVAAALVARRDPWPAPPMACIEAVGTPSTLTRRGTS